VEDEALVLGMTWPDKFTSLILGKRKRLEVTGDTKYLISLIYHLFKKKSNSIFFF